MGKMKCENCGEVAKRCLLEIWVPIKKSWGEEWVLKKICTTCWEAIVADAECGEEKESRIYIISKEDRDYICAQCCNFKECPSDCPLLTTSDTYEIDEIDAEELCAHCKLSMKGCDLKCPIRREEEGIQKQRKPS